MKIDKRLSRFFFLLPALGLAGAPPAQAAAFPDKPIRLVVPYLPGGPTDTLARMLAKPMSEKLGTQIIVENKPGAGGTLGADIVAKSTPDGYTILLTTSTLASAPSVYPHLPFSPARDLRAVGELGRAPFVLVASPNAPFRTFDSFIRYARAHPGELSYASPGNGTPIHLYSELLQRRADISLIHVPYKGGTQSKGDVITGRISVMFDSPVTALPAVQAHQLLALATSRPLKAAPDIPLMSASGLPGFEPEVWYGVVAPAATPDPVVQRLNGAMAAALANADVVRWMDQQGATVAADTSVAAFQHTLVNDVAEWARVVKESQAKID